MQNISVFTTQNVSIDLPLAGLGRRIISYFIDLIIIVLYILFVVFILSRYLGINLESGDSSRFNWALGLILLLPVILYSLYWEILTQGRTPGKWIMGLKVVKINGYKATFKDYFVRWIFRIIDIYIFMLFAALFENDGATKASLLLMGLIAVISISINKKEQRLGDMVAGTTVVNTRYTEKMSITILENLAQDYKPTFPQVVKLSDNDMRIIKDNYKLAAKNHEYKIIAQLVEKVKEVTQIESELPNMKFLDIVIKDFNYYTGQH